MNARIYIDGAVVSQEPVIVIGQKPHMLASVMLGGDDGAHESTFLAIKIVGEIVELERLKARMPEGTSMRLRGRLIGKQKYFLACWARHVTAKEKRA